MASHPLRSQHGPAITAAADEVVTAVTTRLSMLASAGESFTTPDVAEERWARAFAARAVLWSGRRVRKARGNAWQECHAVSSRLVAGDPQRYRHVFGYALNGDSHWRTHSWVHDTLSGDIIEPTPLVRRVYIGVELTAREAGDFEAEE